MGEKIARMNMAALLDNLHVRTAISRSDIERNQDTLEAMTDEQRAAVWLVCANGGELSFGMSAAHVLVPAPSRLPALFAIASTDPDATPPASSSDEGSGE